MISDLIRALQQGTLTPAGMNQLADALNDIERRSDVLADWIEPGSSRPFMRQATIGRLVLTEQLVIDDGAPAISLEADGDAFFGSNISAPATTSLAIFSNAQTYNSEAMGAGDILFGDNSANKANLLWDASEGKILMRGGTTTQGYFNTDGSAVFGGGKVVLDSGGLEVEAGASGTNSIRWTDNPTGTATTFGSLRTWAVGTAPDRTSIFYITAGAEHGGTGYGLLSLTADNGAVGTDNSHLSGQLQISGNGTLSFESNHNHTTTTVPAVTYHIKSTEAVGDGFGMYETYSIDTADHDEEIAAYISTWWTNATYATLESRMKWQMVAGGASIYPLTLGGSENVMNDGGDNLDFRVEGDTATSLLVCDAGLDAVQIGTTTAGVIADFRAASIVLNESGADMDFRVEGDTESKVIFLDASADTVYLGGTTTRLAHDKNGDVWFEGSGAGLAFGASYSDTDSAVTKTTAAQNTWYKATSADYTHPGQLNLVTESDGALTVTKAGKYLVTWAASVWANDTSTVLMGVGVTPSGGSLSVQSDGQNLGDDVANVRCGVGGTAILSLAANDEIALCYRTVSATTPNLYAWGMSLSVVQIGA